MESATQTRTQIVSQDESLADAARRAKQHKACLDLAKTIPASPATDRYAVKALQHTITLCGGKPEVSEIDSSVRQEEYLDRKAQRV